MGNVIVIEDDDNNTNSYAIMSKLESIENLIIESYMATTKQIERIAILITNLKDAREDAVTLQHDLADVSQKFADALAAEKLDEIEDELQLKLAREDAKYYKGLAETAQAAEDVLDAKLADHNAMDARLEELLNTALPLRVDFDFEENANESVDVVKEEKVGDVIVEVNTPVAEISEEVTVPEVPEAVQELLTEAVAEIPVVVSAVEEEVIPLVPIEIQVPVAVVEELVPTPVGEVVVDVVAEVVTTAPPVF